MIDFDFSYMFVYMQILLLLPLSTPRIAKIFSFQQRHLKKHAIFRPFLWRKWRLKYSPILHANFLPSLQSKWKLYLVFLIISFIQWSLNQRKAKQTKLGYFYTSGTYFFFSLVQSLKIFISFITLGTQIKESK